MPRKRTKGLTERETEILSILWELGSASVEEIRTRLPGVPSASTVRSLMGIMEERGLIVDDGTGYGKRYSSCVSQSEAQATAAQRLIETLFAGSAEALLLRLVDAGKVDAEQLKRVQEGLGRKGS